MPLRASSSKVGDRHSAVAVDRLTRTQIVQYAGASGDFNPLHTDEIYATKVAGYPTAFAHGMLTMGLTAKVLTDWVGDGRLTRFGVRFSRQVWPGDTLTTTATVDALREEDGVQLAELSVVTTNQDGVDVVSGYATARIDG
jgi:acyl dehydratase